jgi:GMP synthase-like glutamine amidotransferase
MIIGLLQCDHVSAEFQHIIPDYPQAFRDLFAKYAPSITLRVYDVCHGELPQSVDECEGYITTGSRYSVYDDVPWIHQLAEFVRQVHARNAKFVGICFGHQMLAFALGGTVAKSERGWGIGTKPVSLRKTPEWITPNQTEYRLLLSHQDQVVQLPRGGQILGGNEHCPISMLGVGSNMLGMQAHPEFTPEYARALMQSRIERIGAKTVEEAQQTLAEKTDEATVVHWIQAFFEAH